MGEKPRISFCQKYTATSIALVRPNAKYTSKNGRYILTRRVTSRAISRIERFVGVTCYSPFCRMVLSSVRLIGPPPGAGPSLLRVEPSAPGQVAVAEGQVPIALPGDL